MLVWRRPLPVVAAVAIALAIAACSDGDDSNSATTGGRVASGDDVVFGSGELPQTIPAEFPIPAGSSIGSTLVVTSSGFTELVARVDDGLGVTARFFDQSLVQAGFTVDSSVLQDQLWLIEFSKDGVRGTIDITESAGGISQAVIRYNVP